MITQTDLNEVARIIRNLKPKDYKTYYDEDEYRKRGEINQWEETVKHFADMLESNNPKFKRAKFIKACGGEIWTENETTPSGPSTN